MISRYLVDGVMVAGGVFAAIGCLYLSHGLLGASGVSILRRGSVGLAWSLLPVTWFGSLLFARTHIAVPYQVKPSDWLMLAGYSLGYFVMGYFLGADPDDLHRLDKSYGGLLSLIGRLYFWGFLASTPFLALIAVIAHHLDTWPVVILPGAVALASRCAFGLIKQAGSLTVRQLQVYGLILTLLGIVTQLVSPVLDLLGVTVR